MIVVGPGRLAKGQREPITGDGGCEKYRKLGKSHARV
jgi:hypothetical protein